MHHLDGAASEPEGHGPDGPAPGPIHQIVDLGDHELRRLGEASWGRRGRGRRAFISGGRRGGGGVERRGSVEGEGPLGAELERNARGSSQQSHG